MGTPGTRIMSGFHPTEPFAAPPTNGRLGETVPLV